MRKKNRNKVAKHCRIKIENKEEIKKILPNEKNSIIKQKLLFLNFLANSDNNIEELAKNFGIDKSTGYKWIKIWNTKGYNGLIPIVNKGGRPPKLNEIQLKEIKENLITNSMTLRDVALLIEEKFGIKLSISQLRRILKNKLKAKIVPPYKKNYIKIK